MAVHLHQGDLSAATDSFNTAATTYVILHHSTDQCHIGLTCFSPRMHGFPSSDAAPLLERLLQAYRERDQELFHKCCDDVLFRTMDNEAGMISKG